MIIRPANASDLGAIRVTPETDEARLAWFRGLGEIHPVTVAELDGEVVGWASRNRYHPREAYARTAGNSVYVRASLAVHEAFGFQIVAHFRELGWKHDR